jgi:guanylate kinase
VTDAAALRNATFPLIFAAPSGAGKTSIAQALRDRRDDVVFSVSATTRPSRGYEQDGVHYFFRTEEEFRRMIAEAQLLEWAEVHGNLYGTPRWNLEAARTSGKHLILDIDVQGSRLVRHAVPEAVSIFVLPPSGAELTRRLVGRASEAPEARRRRLEAARHEIAAAAEFDYVIVNEDLAASVDAVEAILKAESMRTKRLVALPELVDRLCDEVDRNLAIEQGEPAEQP